MQSYAFDVVRSHIPSLDLDEAYADADTIAMHIQETLHRAMADYGYEIVKALVTNIEPDQRVKDAMNNINASQRNQIAAAAQGDAQKTLAVKKAEGEKETMRLQGEGVAAERRAIAEGLKESLEIIAEQGLDPKEAMALVALTQYTDMIRALGEASNTNTILLPHSPSGVGDLMTQIRDGILIADAASDSVVSGRKPDRRAARPAPGLQRGADG
jgi:regulator of protease activity HflC (stomatin/prohibitin superfamily)